MKKVVSLVLATSLGVSSLSAVESNTLNQQDKEFLFASNAVNTQVLSEQEMSETKGEFWLAAIGISLGVSALGCIFNGDCSIKLHSPNLSF